MPQNYYFFKDTLSKSKPKRHLTTFFGAFPVCFSDNEVSLSEFGSSIVSLLGFPSVLFLL